MQFNCNGINCNGINCNGINCDSIVMVSNVMVSIAVTVMCSIGTQLCLQCTQNVNKT